MLPEEIVTQFREVSLERLERMEEGWSMLIAQPGIREPAAALHREVHTLKGESRMVGFTDVNLLAHRLEDLFEIAANRDYDVGEDFDLSVTMAIRFMAMLVRKRAGTHLGGIDLPGFIGQIDAVIADAKSVAPRRPRISTPSHRWGTRTRLPPVVRERLATAAVDVFIEAYVGRGGERMQSVWSRLRAVMETEELADAAPQLLKHEEFGRTLLRELGRHGIVEFAVDAFQVGLEILVALDVTVLHLLRNAVDHGIEPPPARLAAGKSEVGRVTVRGTLRHEVVTFVISDDGAGIDYTRVRERAVQFGMLDEAGANVASHDDLNELLFRPGFSTRAGATEISGRGIGLDAVKAAVSGVGGTVELATSANGTTWTVKIPVPALVVGAHVFHPPGIRVACAIRDDWRIVPTSDRTPIDLSDALGVGTTRAMAAATVFSVDNGTKIVTLPTDDAPRPALVQRVIATPPDSVAEIVLIDGAEGLLLRPDRL